MKPYDAYSITIQDMYILWDNTTRSKDTPKFTILLKKLSINPPDKKVYIMHPKAMMIANLVYISV